MNPLTLEWIEKAEADLRTAQREYRVRHAPNYDAVCFHAQQAAEKFLKAALQENGMPIPRIHSLAELLAILAVNTSDFLLTQPDAIILENYSVQFRYPGFSAENGDAKVALDTSERLCSFLRNKLGL